jgi:hypothetical protein
MQTQIEILNEVLRWITKLRPGIYPFKNRYQILKEMSVDKKIYKKGETVLLSSEKGIELIKRGALKFKDDKEKLEAIEKIKFYLDFKGSLPLPDVTFSKDFSKFKIHERILKYEVIRDFSSLGVFYKTGECIIISNEKGFDLCQKEIIRIL